MCAMHCCGLHDLLRVCVLQAKFADSILDLEAGGDGVAINAPNADVVEHSLDVDTLTSLPLPPFLLFQKNNHNNYKNNAATRGMHQ